VPYLDITVIPVPSDAQAAYLEHSAQTTALFKEHGALSVTECWGDDVPDGKLTDFKRSVALEDGETVAVGWITWPDRAARDAGWAALMDDPRMSRLTMPFDAKRMIYAGFEVIADG